MHSASNAALFNLPSLLLCPLMLPCLTACCALGVSSFLWKSALVFCSHANLCHPLFAACWFLSGNIFLMHPTSFRMSTHFQKPEYFIYQWKGLWACNICPNCYPVPFATGTLAVAHEQSQAHQLRVKEKQERDYWLQPPCSTTESDWEGPGTVFFMLIGSNR